MSFKSCWTRRKSRSETSHAHVDTELTIPLSAHVALIGCYTPFNLDSVYMPAYVCGVNSRTIDRAQVFIAACEDRFMLQADGEIITSDQFIAQLEDAVRLKP